MISPLQDVLDSFLENAAKANDKNEIEALKIETTARIKDICQKGETLLSEKEVVTIFRAFSRRTLQAMRQQGRGPRYVKIGENRNSRVLYRIRDVRDFIDQAYIETSDSFRSDG